MSLKGSHVSDSIFYSCPTAFASMARRTEHTTEDGMPKIARPLSELAIKRATYKRHGGNHLFDGGGLYLDVRKSGRKTWRFKYRQDGKQQTRTIGDYPDVTMVKARAERGRLKLLLQQGVNLSLQRQKEKIAHASNAASTFKAVATEWMEQNAAGWANGYTRTVRLRLVNEVFPVIGKYPIAEIDAPVLLEVLRSIEARGYLDTANRVRGYMSRIFRYAIATSRARHDAAADLIGALAKPTRNHYPTMTDPEAIGALLRTIDGYQGHFTTRTALQLAPLVFVRPGELRGAEWLEFDFDQALWSIPASRMKLRTSIKRDSHQPPHLVPLSRQALAILQKLHAFNGEGKLLFPSPRDRNRSMSDNTVNAALRRLGYDKSQMVGHGFRHMASTRLNEQGFPADAIERQLAHKAKGIRGVYNRAEYLPERIRMMQAWADYLDELKAHVQPGNRTCAAEADSVP
jgi:integrase